MKHRNEVGKARSALTAPAFGRQAPPTPSKRWALEVLARLKCFLPRVLEQRGYYFEGQEDWCSAEDTCWEENATSPRGKVIGKGQAHSMAAKGLRCDLAWALVCHNQTERLVTVRILYCHQIH